MSPNRSDPNKLTGVCDGRSRDMEHPMRGRVMGSEPNCEMIR